MPVYFISTDTDLTLTLTEQTPPLSERFSETKVRKYLVVDVVNQGTW